MNMFKKLKTRIILWRIRKAKRLFIEGFSPFMCHCMYEAFDTIDIVSVVPEFTAEFFGREQKYKYSPWFDAGDRQSRICAFNILIGIYENKLK